MSKTAANRDFPWCDCKVAFEIKDDERLWKWHDDEHDYSPPLPDGWHLIETDCSGARCVAIFRIEGELRREDGEKVAATLRRLRIS